MFTIELAFLNISKAYFLEASLPFFKISLVLIISSIVLGSLDLIDKTGFGGNGIPKENVELDKKD